MIKFSNKKDCCGCQACVQACNHNCISFVQDDYGFYYPEIDESQCNNCHLCEMVCPILNVKDYQFPKDTETIAAVNSDPIQRKSSSSGGVFQLIAQKIIEDNGVVFGASFADDYSVRHSFADSVDQIEPLKRSKYAQSYIGMSYRQVKDFLIKGRIVAFVGTPCQVAGLKSFLKKDYPNLFTIDLICHGVPSPMVWMQYLEEKKKELAIRHGLKSKDDIIFTNINFRDKIKLWRKFNITFSYIVSGNESSEIFSDTQPIWENGYMLSFLNNYCLRPSCFDCKFRNGKSRSDLTLADFWGIEQCTKDEFFTGEKGTSLVMIHNAKAHDLIGSLNFIKQNFSFDNGVKANGAFYRNFPKPFNYDLFFSLLNSKSVSDAYFESYSKDSLFNILTTSNNIFIKIIRKIWQKLV